MTRMQVLRLRDDTPILLKDGRVGLLIRYPGSDELTGIQVYGEEAIRWVYCSDLEKSEFGALRQVGSMIPMNPSRIGDDTARSAHLLLSMTWARMAADWLGEVK